METNKNFPVYEMVISNETDGVYAVSLVENPAMEVSWITANKDAQQVKCEVINEEEKIIICVIARADFQFLQYSPAIGYYYAYFTKDTLKQTAHNILKNGFQNCINIEHRPNSYIDGVEMRELFIKDISRGINPVGFEDVEDGSLMAVYKVYNEEVWSAIKQGIFTSVSLEGFFMPISHNDIIESEEQLMEWFENM